MIKVTVPYKPRRPRPSSLWDEVERLLARNLEAIKRSRALLSKPVYGLSVLAPRETP